MNWLDRHGGPIERRAPAVKLSAYLSNLTRIAHSILKDMLNDSSSSIAHSRRCPIRSAAECSAAVARPCFRVGTCRAVQHQPSCRPSAFESAGGKRIGSIREEGPSAYRAAGGEGALRRGMLDRRAARRMGSAARPVRELSSNPKERRQNDGERTDLVLERTLDAPIDLVWEAYTKPEHLKRWFAPKPYEITEMELDLRPAGFSASE